LILIFIFSTVKSSYLESLNPKNGISLQCNYVTLQELIYDFAINTIHQLFVLQISGSAQ